MTIFPVLLGLFVAALVLGTVVCFVKSVLGDGDQWTFAGFLGTAATLHITVFAMVGFAQRFPDHQWTWITLALIVTAFDVAVAIAGNNHRRQLVPAIAQR